MFYFLPLHTNFYKPLLLCLLTVACLFGCKPAMCQEANTGSVVNFPLAHEDVSLYDHALVRIETGSRETPPSVVARRAFVPAKEFFNSDEFRFADSVKSCWVRFSIANNTTSDTTVALLFPGAVAKAVLYQEEGNNLFPVGKTGFFFSMSAIQVDNQENRFDIPLKAKAQTRYAIQVLIYHDGIWFNKMPVLESLPYADMMAFRSARQVKRLHLLWSHFFTGVFFMFFVFGFIKYLMLGRDKAYLYYSLMGFFCALITIAQAEDPPLELPWFENLRGVEFFDLLRTTAFIMQGMFILEILHLKARYPRVTKAIKWYFLIHFLLATAITIVGFERLYFEVLSDLDLYDHFFLHLLLLGWVVYMATIRKGFYRFIFLGSLTVFIAYTIMFAIAFFQLHYLLPAWFNTDGRASVWHFMTVALVIDMLFYFTGLAYRDRQVEKDKALFEEQLKLEKAESARSKAELQQQATELEMQALRAQMNPHFIFNSLNSINRFILQNNKLQASEYLTKFSKLVRLILQNSRASLILLESELESLQLYLELEALRFDNQFEYLIKVKEDIDISALKVPPLLIQPFVENAIWHGLMHREGKGHLEIELSQKDDVLCCKITDDGIGRMKAAELKSKSASMHKSMGMQITADRIANLRQNKQAETSIVIADVVLPDGTAGGTEVFLKLPMIV